jgi:hypothetical protein
MTTTAKASVWDVLDRRPTLKQGLFLRYFTAVLVDLVVLNLFVEFWSYVTIDSFTISLLAAAVLQLLLKLTIVAEHKVAAFFSARPGSFNRFMRFFGAWLILFGSKFVILEALDFAFGASVDFSGPFNGLLALIVVVVAMLAAEAALVKFYRRLGE